MLRPDVAFMLYAAGRLLDGARLYVDVVEINPPLILWLNLPVGATARLLELPPALVYRAAVLLLQAASLGVSAVLLRRILPAESRLQRGLLLLVGIVLLSMVGMDFGEREHLTLALVLPYAWLVVMRVRGVAVAGPAAALLGAMAGIGLALKPHFLLGWAGLELYRRLKVGRLSAATPENTAVLAVLLAYAVSVLLFVPRYLALLSALGPAYARFLQAPLGDLLLTVPGIALALLALTWTALGGRTRHPELWEVLLVASAGFYLGGLLQLKGLPYHFYPSFGLATIAVGGLVLDLPASLSRLSERVYRLVASAAVLALSVAVVGRTLRNAATEGWGAPRDAPFGRLVELVERHAAGGSVFVFSHHIGSTFPLVNHAGVRSASRFPHLWILAAEYVDRMRAAEPLRYRDPARMSRAERYLNASVLADLERHRPDLLLVLRNARDDRVNGLRRLDHLAYFGRDPRFAELFARYELLDRVGEYTVYRRLEEGEPRSAPMPASTPGTLDVLLPGPVYRLRFGGEALMFAVAFVLALVVLGRRETRVAAP